MYQFLWLTLYFSEMTLSKGLLRAFSTPCRPQIMTVPIKCCNWCLLGVSGVLKKPSLGLLAFLGIYCILISDQNKRHKGLVSVMKQNGHMLPLSGCARNKNSTLFFYQTSWLLFFTFSGTPCIIYLKMMCSK